MVKQDETGAFVHNFQIYQPLIFERPEPAQVYELDHGTRKDYHKLENQLFLHKEAYKRKK